MSDLSGISVVLPSLNPDEKLLAVIDGLLQYGFTDIILVNDGSAAENMHYFETAATHPEVQLLHHEVNRGKGAALKTAFTWFLENRPDAIGVVTVDGDNQHHGEDTRACALHMRQTNHLTLGVRDFSQENVPLRSRTGNRITSAVFKIFVGMTISDTQTGLRAIPRADLEILNTVWGDRFEYETNMLLALKEHGIPFDEVKIRTVYIEENKSSHFHPVRDSWRIYKLILAHFFKYTVSSLLSSVIDTAVYVLLAWLLSGVMNDPLLTTVSITVARILSSLFNFFMNQKMVFKSRLSTGTSMLRYTILAVVIFVGQLALTYGIYALFGIGESQILLRGVIYVAVMTALFIVSFLAQQRWVFANEYTAK
ncbi:MAG: bifunctional glycosyltransferase family 2/GtrA family protein [Oscillospiraceae bacterium]|nr:bifunctional glycosyltransferase family 2/GtrA family protein [Oscillospiraceae bacterium]